MASTRRKSMETRANFRTGALRAHALMLWCIYLTIVKLTLTAATYHTP